MSNLQTILSLLPQLNATELETIRQAIKMTGSAPIDPTEIITDPAEQTILDCICRLMQNRGLEFYPIKQLRADPQYRKFRDQMPDLMQYFLAACPSRVHRQAVLQLGIILLYENLVEMNVPVSGRTMMRNVYRIPAVINRAFPGYAQSGVLHKIVQPKKGLTHVRTKRSLPQVSTTRRITAGQ